MRKAQKNAAAVALGKRRAATRTREEQAAYARLPRKPDAERCPCGEMTLKRALARGHRC
jgi:hypothetical protein